MKKYTISKLFLILIDIVAIVIFFFYYYLAIRLLGSNHILFFGLSIISSGIIIIMTSLAWKSYVGIQKEQLVIFRRDVENGILTIQYVEIKSIEYNKYLKSLIIRGSFDNVIYLSKTYRNSNQMFQEFLQLATKSNKSIRLDSTCNALLQKQK